MVEKLKIGVMATLVEKPESEIKKVREFGLDSCQVCSWKPDIWTEEVGQRLIKAADRYEVEITTFWSGLAGPQVWNFTEGPETIGLVPPDIENNESKH